MMGWQFERILLEHRGKVPILECLSVKRQGLLLSVYVDDIKLAGKKENIDHLWKRSRKKVDVGEPTSILDHVHFLCTQRESKNSEDFVDNCRNMFESRVSAGATATLPNARPDT